MDADEPEQIRVATRELLESILERNQITEYDDIVSAIFTTTDDLVSTFPAEAARELGMTQVPLLCAREIPVPNSKPRCVRVLLHVNSDVSPADIVHVYLRDAQTLRQDIGEAQ